MARQGGHLGSNNNTEGLLVGGRAPTSNLRAE
jgi:hypothetical protein